MNKKPHKVDEPAAPYPAKQAPEKGTVPAPTTDGVRRLETAVFKKSAAKVFKNHHELLRKLAQ